MHLTPAIAGPEYQINSDGSLSVNPLYFDNFFAYNGNQKPVYGGKVENRRKPIIKSGLKTLKVYDKGHDPNFNKFAPHWFVD
jgi:hypothetical protein